MLLSPRLSKISALLGIATALLTIISDLPSLALTTEDIDAIASQTTVLIARGLQKSDLENKREWNPGSGVIVARNGNTYYAITNTHVVKQPNSENIWGVRTPDGEVHPVSDTGDNIVRFGTYEGNDKPINGFDLALVKFTSDRPYAVAVMGNSAQLKSGDTLFVSGWPQPEDLSARRERLFKEGKVATIASSPSNDGGYDVLYSNWTRPGMSGGPVFSVDGELVGIHGRGRKKSDTLYCIDSVANTENSCGIQAIHFISQAEASRIKLNYTLPPVNSSVVALGKANKNHADLIQDIYGLFTDLKKIKDRVSDIEQRIERLTNRRN